MKNVKYLLISFILFNFGDLFITLKFFNAEINPLVLLDIETFIAVKLVTTLVFFLAYVSVVKNDNWSIW